MNIKLKTLVKNFKNNRQILSSYICAVGILTTLISILIIPSTRITFNLFMGLVVFPFFILSPDTLLRMWRTSVIFRLVLFLLTLNFLSLFWGATKADTHTMFKFIHHIFYIIAFIGGCYQSISVLKSWKKSMDAILILSFIGASVALFVFFRDPETQRLTYHLKDFHPNGTGWIYGLLSVGIMGNLLFKKTSRVVQFICFVSLSVLFTSVMFTSSRTSILGVLFSVLTFWFFTQDRRVLIPVFSVFFAVFIYSVDSAFLEKANDRSIISTTRLVTRKGSGRIRLWKELIGEMKSKEYLFGKGFLENDSNKTNSNVPHPHSLFLSSFFHGGGVVLFIHAWIVVLVMFKGYLMTRNGSILLLLLCVFTVFPSLFDGKTIIHINSVFSPDMFIFWIPVALSISYDTPTLLPDKRVGTK